MIRRLYSPSAFIKQGIRETDLRQCPSGLLMHSIVVIQHLILPREPINTLAVASSIRAIEAFNTSLVDSHVAIEIAVAGDGLVASWVLAMIAAGRYVARVEVMSILLKWGLPMVCSILGAWVLWSSDSHLRVMGEMALGICSGLDGVVAACKRNP